MISILLADDHKMLCETWSVLLGKDNRFEVIGFCSNSKDTVKATRKLKPDILLLDINMLPFNGFEATRQIRMNCAKTHIIALTMYNQPAYAIKMLELGAKGYLTKNSSLAEITKAILEVSKGNTFICEEMEELLTIPHGSNKHISVINTLTEREIEVINLIKGGLSSKEISQKLDISIHTVQAHRYNVFKKLSVKNTASLIYFWNDARHLR